MSRTWSGSASSASVPYPAAFSHRGHGRRRDALGRLGPRSYSYTMCENVINEFVGGLAGVRVLTSPPTAPSTSSSASGSRTAIAGPANKPSIRYNPKHQHALLGVLMHVDFAPWQKQSPNT